MAAEFSLNTQMILLSKKTLWLSDGSMGFGQESDIAFAEGMASHMETLNCLFWAAVAVVFGYFWIQ